MFKHNIKERTIKYAVLFQSNSGNTAKLAKVIYDSIYSEKKILADLRKVDQIPLAEIYFIGFPVYNQSCSLHVMECLNAIKCTKLSIFGTCGLYPTEKYLNQIEKTVVAWLDDSVEYLGMYMCQGKTTEVQKKVFLGNQIEGSEATELMQRMLNEGDSHPDEYDLHQAKEFMLSVLEMTESEGGL